MSLVNLDAAQTRINVHLDKSRRWVSSCRLANRRIQAYHCIIAMCVIDPALLMLGFFIMLRIRSKSLKLKFHRLPMKYGRHRRSFSVRPSRNIKASGGSKGKTTKPPPAVETTVLVCVYTEEGQIRYLIVIIHQRLLRSGDVELNPGPLDSEWLMCSTCRIVRYCVHNATSA